MARSSCPRCEGTNFEMVENGKIKNAAFKYMFIQCASCGCVVGTTDYLNIGYALEKIMKHLGISFN